MEEVPEGVPIQRTTIPRPNPFAQSMIEHPHAGIFSQKQHGLNYIGVAVPVGQLDSYQLMALARVAAMYGNNTVRLTVWQNVLLPGIQIEDLEKAKAALLEVGLDWKQSNPKAASLLVLETDTAHMQNLTPKGTHWKSASSLKNTWKQTSQ